MNYAELTSAICSYTQNYEQDFVTNIPVFLRQAEQRIYNTVQFPLQRKHAILATVASDKHLACPSDFLAVYSMAVVLSTGSYEYLLNKDVNFIRAAYPNPASTGVPRYYALFGPDTTAPNAYDKLRFILGPTPDAVYSVDLQYLYYPESITVAADGRTWLGDNFDTVLLYGALVEAAVFMKSEADMMSYYELKYKEALAHASRMGDGLERTDAYRSGQYRAAPLPQDSGVK